MSVGSKLEMVILPSLLTVLLPETQVGSVAADVAVGKALTTTCAVSVQIIPPLVTAYTNLYVPAPLKPEILPEASIVAEAGLAGLPTGAHVPPAVTAVSLAVFVG